MQASEGVREEGGRGEGGTTYPIDFPLFGRDDCDDFDWGRHVYSLLSMALSFFLSFFLSLFGLVKELVG